MLKFKKKKEPVEAAQEEAITNEEQISGSDDLSPEVVALMEQNKLLVAQNKEYKQAETEQTRVDSITRYATKLNTVEIGEACIKDGSTFEVSLLQMVDSHLETKEDMEDSFEETAAETGGVNHEDGDQDGEPKNFGEAIMAIKKRENCTAKEAAEMAKVEYRSLLSKNYNK